MITRGRNVFFYLLVSLFDFPSHIASYVEYRKSAIGLTKLSVPRRDGRNKSYQAMAHGFLRTAAPSSGRRGQRTRM